MVTIRQVSVFVENRSGRLAEVANKLADENINIRALSVADTSEFGILRLVVPDADRTAQVLRDGGFAVGEAQVFAVEVPDRPGGLAGVLTVLARQEINIEYCYAYGPVEGTEVAVLMFRVQDEQMQQAAQLFEKSGIRTLSEADLAAL